ncbi:nuclease-related domain-containing protein [Siminovitchia sp. 179-K 8D1 HS]|uniref:nuclease-related domain-containing protein n=1 Tax=Siminovitchia sp. 179-K 8D1 HS TaxID=3142385 RepID=UPI0039A17589
MAQLIKLQDYVSRYEKDLSEYSSKFVRLKKRRWQAIVNSMGQRVGTNTGLAKAETGLKQSFLDKLYLSQIQWASTTITERSFVQSTYYTDKRLRDLLQRFPDSFFVMYKPVLRFEKTEVELEALLLTPSTIFCLAFLNGAEGAVYFGSSAHFWMNAADTGDKVLNPLISANRIFKVVSRIFRENGVELPIQRAVIAENSYMDYPNGPHDILFIDKRNYESWRRNLAKLRSPVKSMQMRGAKALLESSLTRSIKRTK